MDSEGFDEGPGDISSDGGVAERERRDQPEYLLKLLTCDEF